MGLVCTNNSMAEKELVTEVPFKLTNNFEYLGINLTQDVKGLYEEIIKY